MIDTILEYYDYLVNHTLLLVVVLITMFGLIGVLNDYFKYKKKTK